MIFEASIRSASVSLLVFWVVLFPVDFQSYGLAEFFATAAIVSGFCWVIGFLMSLLCLLPLCFVFEFTSRQFSLFLFALTGFLIPALAQLQYLAIGFHGKVAPLFSVDAGNLLTGIISVGLVGLAGAIAAWVSLFRGIAPNKSNQSDAAKAAPVV